MQASWYL